jgi:hypothetical protein
MKRQHPTDPNLFWCQKCLKYKVREEFNKHKSKPFGINSWCKKCHRDYIKEYLYRAQGLALIRKRELSKAYYSDHPEIAKKSWERRRQAFLRDHHDVVIQSKRKWTSNQVREVTDGYVKKMLRDHGVEQPSNELAEIVRQRIIMKRTLKQFKKWRDKNESGNPDVPEEQCQNGSLDESNNGR